MLLSIGNSSGSGVEACEITTKRVVLAVEERKVSSVGGNHPAKRPQLTLSTVLNVRVYNLQPVNLGALDGANGKSLLVLCCFLCRLGRRVDRYNLCARIPSCQISYALPQALFRAARKSVSPFLAAAAYPPSPEAELTCS